MKVFQYIILVVVFQVGFISIGKPFTASQTAARFKMVKPIHHDCGELLIEISESLNTEKSETEHNLTLPIVTYLVEKFFAYATSTLQLFCPHLVNSIQTRPLYLQTGKLSI